MDERTETKHCPRCRQALPAAEFGWRDREHHKKLVAKRRRRRVDRHRERIERVESRPCQDCGGRFPPEAMDFDHVRGTRLGELSKLMSSFGTDRLLEEIAKCDIVCAVCHRVRTQRRAERNRRSNGPD